MDAELLRMAKEFGKAMAEAQYKHFTEMAKVNKSTSSGDDIKGRGGNANALNPGERRDDSITKAINKFEKSVDKFYTATKKGYESQYGNPKGFFGHLNKLVTTHGATAWAFKEGRVNIRKQTFGEAIDMRDSATGQTHKIYGSIVKDALKGDIKVTLAARQKEVEGMDTMFRALLDTSRGLADFDTRLENAVKTISGSSLGDVISKKLNSREKAIYDKIMKVGVKSDTQISALGDAKLIKEAEELKDNQIKVLQRVSELARDAVKLTEDEISSLSTMLLGRAGGKSGEVDILNGISLSLMPAIENMLSDDKLEKFKAGLSGKNNVTEMTEVYKNINSGMTEMDRFVELVKNTNLTDPMSDELSKLTTTMAEAGSNLNSVMRAAFQDGAKATVDSIQTIMGNIEYLKMEEENFIKEGFVEQANETNTARQGLVLELKQLSEKMEVMSTYIHDSNALLDPSVDRTSDQTEMLETLNKHGHIISDSTHVGSALGKLTENSNQSISDIIFALAKSVDSNEEILAKNLTGVENNAAYARADAILETIGTLLTSVDNSIKLTGGATIEGIEQVVNKLMAGDISPKELGPNFDINIFNDAIREGLEGIGSHAGEAAAAMMQKTMAADKISAIDDDHEQAKIIERENKRSRKIDSVLDTTERHALDTAAILESLGFAVSNTREEMISNMWKGTKWGIGVFVAGFTQIWSDGAYAIRGQIEEQRRGQAIAMGMSNKELLTGMLVYRDTLRKMASEQGIDFDQLDMEQLQDMGKKYAISGEEAFHYGLRMKEATQLTALGSKTNLEQMSDFYANSARLLNMTVDEFGEQFSEMANDPGLIAFMNIMKGVGPDIQGALTKELATRIKVNKVLGQSNEQMKERMRAEAGQKFSGIEAFIRRAVGTDMEMSTLSEVSGINFTDRDKYLAGLNPNDMTQEQRLEWEKSGRVKYETAYAIAAEKHTKALESASSDDERDAINAEYRTIMTMLEQFRGIHGQTSATEGTDARYNNIVSLLSGTSLEGKAFDVINNMIDWTDIRGSVGDKIADQLETTLGFNENRVEAGFTRQQFLGLAENVAGIAQSGIGKMVGGILGTVGWILGQLMFTNSILLGQGLLGKGMFLGLGKKILDLGKGIGSGTLGLGKNIVSAVATAAAGGASYAAKAGTALSGVTSANIASGVGKTLGVLGKAGGWLAAGAVVKDAFDVVTTDGKAKMEDKGGVVGGLGGAGIGAAIGTLLFPGLGTAAGAWLGAGIGNWIGESVGQHFDATDAAKQILDEKLKGTDARNTLSQHEDLQGTKNLTEAITENTETVKKSTQSFKEQTNKHAGRLDQFVNQITNLSDRDFSPEVEDFARNAAFKSTFA